MAITESLVVQILADSSQLQQELSNVAEQLAGLGSSLEGLSQMGGEVDAALAQFGGALRPLQGLSNLLSQITLQIQALSQQPVTLNVAPALQALQELMQMAQAVARQIAAMNFAMMGGAMLPGMAPAAAQPEGGGRMAGYATGGYVDGPSGIDVIPARLTAGEYVMNRGATAILGRSFLDQLNATGTVPLQPATGGSMGIPAATPVRIPAVLPAREFSAVARHAGISRSGVIAEPTARQTINHFGGISIQVRGAGELDQVMQNLERQEIAARYRQG